MGCAINHLCFKKMNVDQITISNRTIEKAENLKTQFNNIQIVKWEMFLNLI